MTATHIGHAHLKVRDLDRALEFYTRFFGLHLVERVGDHYAFLSGGGYHHEIALQNVGPHAPQPPPHGTGLYHVAFEVPDRQSLALAYQALTEAGISCRSGRSLDQLGALLQRSRWQRPGDLLGHAG